MRFSNESYYPPLYGVPCEDEHGQYRHFASHDRAVDLGVLRERGGHAPDERGDGQGLGRGGGGRFVSLFAKRVKTRFPDHVPEQPRGDLRPLGGGGAP